MAPHQGLCTGYLHVHICEKHVCYFFSLLNPYGNGIMHPHSLKQTLLNYFLMRDYFKNFNDVTAAKALNNAKKKNKY